VNTTVSADVRAHASHLDVHVTITLGAFRRVYDIRTDARTFGITGPSGVGKSVLLRALAGVERAVSGTVTFRGITWQSTAARVFVPPWVRSVGWVPQDALLFPHRSVLGNLRIAAAAEAGQVEEIAHFLGIAHLLDRTPRHLSGGERQRVALGRALLANPKLLLLDEPFAALDPARRAQITESLRAWLHERDVTTVLVSHDRDDVAQLCDDAIELADER